MKDLSSLLLNRFRDPLLYGLIAFIGARFYLKETQSASLILIFTIIYVISHIIFEYCLLLRSDSNPKPLSFLASLELKLLAAALFLSIIFGVVAFFIFKKSFTELLVLTPLLFISLAPRSLSRASQLFLIPKVNSGSATPSEYYITLSSVDAVIVKNDEILEKSLTFSHIFFDGQITPSKSLLGDDRIPKFIALT